MSGAKYEADLARTVPSVGSDQTAGQHPGVEAENFAVLDHAIRRIDDLIDYSNRRSTEGARQVDTTFLSAFWLTIAAIVIAVCGVLEPSCGSAATSARRSAG